MGALDHHLRKPVEGPDPEGPCVGVDRPFGILESRIPVACTQDADGAFYHQLQHVAGVGNKPSLAVQKPDAYY